MDTPSNQPKNIIDRRIRRIIAEIIRALRKGPRTLNTTSIPQFTSAMETILAPKDMSVSPYAITLKTSKVWINGKQRSIVAMLILLLIAGILVASLITPLIRSTSTSQDPNKNLIPTLSTDVTTLNSTNHKATVSSTINGEISSATWNYNFSHAQLDNIIEITINSTSDQFVVDYVPTDATDVSGNITINSKSVDGYASNSIVINVSSYFPKGDGSNWIGVESGTIEVSNFDEVNKTCSIGASTDFVSRDLYIPDFIYKDNNISKAYKIVGIVEEGFATDVAKWPRGVGGIVSFPKYLTHVSRKAFKRDFGLWGYIITAVDFSRVEIGRDNVQFGSSIFTGNTPLASDPWIVGKGLY